MSSFSRLAPGTTFLLFPCSFLGLVLEKCVGQRKLQNRPSYRRRLAEWASLAGARNQGGGRVHGSAKTLSAGKLVFCGEQRSPRREKALSEGSRPACMVHVKASQDDLLVLRRD